MQLKKGAQVLVEHKHLMSGSIIKVENELGVHEYLSRAVAVN